jgi:hypothetical protein
MKSTSYTIGIMKKIVTAVAVSMMFLSLSFIAFAQTPGNIQTTPANGTPGNIQVSPPTVSTTLKNPIKYDTFSSFIAAVTKTAVQILFPFIILAFIYSGFLFVKAQGNETELAHAKTAITYSMIGAFILLGAWGFAQIISQTVSTLTQ